MKKGRIIQFADGNYGYQRLFLGIFPLREFLYRDLDSRDSWNFHLIVRSYSKWGTLKELKSFINELENYKNPDSIARVIEQTELEKALL